MDKVCKNCQHYKEHTDEKKKIHYLCYHGDVTNIFFFGPKRVGPHDTCMHFQQKTR